MSATAQTQLLAAIDAVESANRKFKAGEYAKAVSEAGAAVGLLKQFQGMCEREHGTNPRLSAAQPK